MEKDMITFVIPLRLYKGLGHANTKAIIDLALLINRVNFDGVLQITPSASPNISITFATAEAIPQSKKSLLRSWFSVYFLKWWQYYATNTTSFTIRD